jgi:F-type H+-transporting ATPase subunit b
MKLASVFPLAAHFPLASRLAPAARFPLVAGISAASLLLAAPAHAAAGGSMDLVWQGLNLLLLIAVLVYFARKPIQNFFADRRSQIKSDLDQSAELLEAAETRYADWQRKLIELDEETEKIRADGLRHAEEDAAQILADAQAVAERIHRDAETAVEQELRRAQAELRAEAATLATELAERILKAQLADSDRERLLDEFIVSVEPGSSRGAN